MGQLVRFPAAEGIFDRLTEQQRRANIAAEREEHRQAALFVIRNHAWHSRQDVEDAWVNLAIYGTDHERQVARDKIADLTAPQSPLDVVRDHRARWPAIIAYGAVGAAILLAFTGWL